MHQHNHMKSEESMAEMTLPSTPTTKDIPELSFWTMCKNEGVTLRQTVESILPLAEEIVFRVDDKSTDDTEKIMLEYQEKFKGKIPVSVERFTWQNDFAKARNNAIKGCNGKWQFWLDGHEYLKEGSAEAIRWYMNTLKDKLNVWMVETAMYMQPQDGIPATFFLQPHMWRTIKDPEFKAHLEKMIVLVEEMIASWNHEAKDLIEDEKKKLCEILGYQELESLHPLKKENWDDLLEEREAINNLLQRPQWLEEKKKRLADILSELEAIKNKKLPEDEENIALLPLEAERDKIEGVLTGVGIHYCEKIHNCIYKETVPSHHRIPSAEIVIIHDRTHENEEARKIQRKELNVPYFQDRIRRNPKDYRAHFYLANQYMMEERYEEAIKVYEEYLKVTDWPDEKYQVMYNMAAIYDEQMKRPNKAKELLLDLIKVRWDRAEAYVTLAHLAAKNAEYKEAEHWAKLACNMRPPLTKLFMNGAFYTYEGWKILAAVYFTCGAFQEGVQCCKEVFRFSPNEKGTWKLLHDAMKAYGHLSVPENPKGKKIVVFDSLGQFSSSFVEHWKKDNEVVFLKSFNPLYVYDWADIAFFEWVDQNLIDASTRRWPCKVYARLHGYETLDGYVGQIKWENVDRLIIVNEALREYTQNRYRDAIKTPISVVDNGVDLTKFQWSEHGHGNKIGWAGFINWKKQPGLLLQIASELRDYKFLVAGNFQDERTKEYFFHLMKELQLKNIELLGRVEDMVGFYKEINYLVTTSMYESPSYAILEAMACGVKPLIHHFVRAEDHYPEKLIWRTIPHLKRLMRQKEYASLGYRNFVAERYPVSKMLQEFDRLVLAS